MVVVVLGAVLLGGSVPSQALDLTGTWDTRDGGPARCKYLRSSGVKESGVLSLNPVQISQSGSTARMLTCAIGGCTGETKFTGVVTALATDVNQGGAVATSCSPGLPEAGTLYFKSAKADPTEGKITAVWLGLNPLGSIASCKLRLVRTSATDPGLTGCP
jgi:hypothetical protein